MIYSQHHPEVLRPALTQPTSESAASQPAFFLRTKLLPPRPAPALLPRPRLIERLAANLTRSVTLVTANAGAGKTTLVADFVRAHSPQFVWYQLDHTDADPAIFLSYITHGIRQLIPDFGQSMLAYLKQSAAEVAQHPERAVDMLLNEVLDRVEQQLVIVLDDYHHLGAADAVHAAVDRLLAYQPDVLHTILISRDAPPLQLAKLRSKGALTTVDRDDLLFTEEEMQALFRQVFGLELTTEQLGEFRQRTQGWVMSLQLIWQVTQRQSSPHADAPVALLNLSEVLRQSERDLFDYFAEEVFEFEPENVRWLLLRISLLERIEFETCARLYPESGCSVILPSLVRRNVFTTVASDGNGEEYRLHPLFQGFLRRRLRSEIGKAEVAAEHARIAEHFSFHENWEQATRHYLAADEFDEAARLIAEKGQAWITSGALTSLIVLTEALPNDAIENNPRVLTHRAEVARLRGQYDVAQPLLRRATVLLREQNDSEGEAEALHSLATIARRRGNFEEAFAHLDRAIELAGEQSVVRVKCGNTRGLCLVSQGKWTEAEYEFRAALQLAEEQHDEHYARLIVHNLGLPSMMRGDFGEALRWLRRLLRDDRKSLPLPQEATAHLNMARCHYYRGEFEACERRLDLALELCQLFSLVSARAETFETYGNLYRELGDTARAAQFYERAEQDYDKAGIEPARRELLDEQALLKLQTGELGGARRLIDQLISSRHQLNDETRLHTSALTRGRVLIAQGEHEQARADLEPALAYFHRNHFYYYEAQACVELALTDQAFSNETAMLERMRRALDLASRYDYEYWLKRKAASAPQLFALPEVADLLPPDLKAQAATASLPEIPQPAQVVSLRPMADLTINLFGPVEIYRDSRRPFSADAWTTRRAHDILCFVASRRHRRASKDAIIETFWGDTDPDVVLRNFHPTVSHIRKALNSNQPLKLNFLLYRDGAYLLNPEFTYAIDIEEFDRLLAEGEAARRAKQMTLCVDRFETAIKLYRGEFMQGCYDDWAEEQRSYYLEQYLHILETLVAHAQNAEEWSRSLHLSQQILRVDAFREDIHCLVMRAHAAQGNLVAVREHYEKLRVLLHNELSIQPSAETQKIYRQLIS
ncbi:MAG: tetratricopeptide repeat protein [Acidobacteria bacterium]|nr:tetratricopeptide repeat protein [Acidobacteriota bacterium]